VDAPSGRLHAAEIRLARLGAQLETKPDRIFDFQKLFAINASILALFGLAALVIRSLGATL
jgi:hypothetical protein